MQIHNSEAKDPLSLKSYELALVVSKEVLLIKDSKKEFHLTSQLLRSVTSISANIAESIGCQSKADFYNKISIAHKEAYETRFWLKLFKDLSLTDETFYLKSNNLLNEIIMIIGKSRSTLRKSIRLNT
jgi:four helix bundle protein